MFGVYFTPVFFPTGWGGLGNLPEGSISGITALHITAIGDLSSSDVFGGSASFGFSAVGSLTFSGQPVVVGGWIDWRPEKAQAKPGWMSGQARLVVLAYGEGSVREVEQPAPPQPTPDPQPAEVRPVAMVATLPLVAFTFDPSLEMDAPRPVLQLAEPVRIVRQVEASGKAGALHLASAGTATATGFMGGKARVGQITAHGDPSTEIVIDDSEEIALLLMMLRAAA